MMRWKNMAPSFVGAETVTQSRRTRIGSGRPYVGAPPKGPKPRDIYVPNLHIDSIKPKTRNQMTDE
jgi:hypothetical protein